MKVAIYARVSTSNGKQSPESQLNDLREYAKNRKFTIHEEYVDLGISGKTENRPGLNRLLADARKRRFDGVLVFKFDRFARSTRHLVESLEEFQSLGIAFLSFTEGIDTGSPMGKAMFTIVGAIAELERSLIVERVKSGLRTARAKGKVLGRPRVSVDRRKATLMRGQGKSIRQIASALGVSRGTAHTLVGVVS